MAVRLCVSVRRRSRREGEQGLWEVRGEVQKPRRRLCEGGRQNRRLVEQREGQRRAVGQHVRG